MAPAANASRLFVPPFPQRAERPRGALSTLLTLRRNPLEIWGKAAFEQPFWVGPSFLGMRAMAHDPAAVRHVLLDNAVELSQGRTAAPHPEPRARRRRADGRRRGLAGAAPGARAAVLAARGRRASLLRSTGSRSAVVERLARRRDGSVIEVGELMSRLTLEVLEQTLFSQGLGKEPSAFQHALTRYINTFGRLDPLDLLGAPAFVPRIGRLRGRGTLKFFDEAVEGIIERRRAVIRDGGEPPRDLLTLIAGGAGSGDRRRPAGSQHPRQYRHLHQRRPRDDGECADLDALSPLAGAGMARARRGRSVFRV